jgi:hypothetical protein
MQQHTAKVLHASHRPHTVRISRKGLYFALQQMRGVDVGLMARIRLG